MKGFIKFGLVVAFLLMVSIPSHGQSTNDAPLSENAPTDVPHSFKGSNELKKYDALIAPYVKKARKTLPKAKKKYANGLKEGQAFFLTTRIFDGSGNYEQIFVRITKWENNSISGTIANNINTVSGYAFGQIIKFPESAVLDWLITNPDGSEEGNFVGNFLDSLKR